MCNVEYLYYKNVCKIPYNEVFNFKKAVTYQRGILQEFVPQAIPISQRATAVI